MALRITFGVLYTVVVWLVAVAFFGLGWNATGPVAFALVGAISCGLEFAWPLDDKSPWGGMASLLIGVGGFILMAVSCLFLLAVYSAPLHIDAHIHYGAVDAALAAQMWFGLAGAAAAAILGFLPFFLEELAVRIESMRAR